MKSIRFGLIVAIIGMMALPTMSLADDSSTPSLTWNAWGRGLFVPMASPDDGETVPRDTASWGGDSRIGFTLKGESDRVGFWVDMKADGGKINGRDTTSKTFESDPILVYEDDPNNPGNPLFVTAKTEVVYGDSYLQDQQKIWVKPFSFLTVEAGPTIFYDELRGNSMYGAWNWWRFNNIEGEDNIFLRGVVGGGDGRWHNRYNGTYESVPDAGALIHADTNNFHAFAAWNIVENPRTFEYYADVDANPNTPDELVGTYTEQYTTSLMIARGQYGFGYDIDGIGQARIQYIGKAYMKDDEVYTDDDELESYGIINAAFKLDQLVKNLYLDMGVFLTTDDDAENTKAAIYGNYKIGRFTPHLLISAEFDKLKYDAEDDDDTDTGLKIGLGADVDLGSGLTLNLDLRIHNETATGAEDGQTAYLVGIQKGFSNGIIGIGYEATNRNWPNGVKNYEDDEPDENAWAIPIKLEYWF